MDVASVGDGRVGDGRAVGAAAAALHSHHHSGEIPGAGRYQCEVCGTRLTLAEADAALPMCAHCHGTEFRSVHD